MPSRNRIKTYVENGYYHLYNRGVEKRDVFLDAQDYRVFLYLLKTYLSPPAAESKETEKVGPFVRVRPSRINVSQEVKLLAYCLLPNHFHLLLRQHTKNGMTKLMRALTTSYVMYFNDKYERVGTLFQGTYKAAWIGEGNAGDAYLLQLSRYIHLNPKFELQGSDPCSWPYSSYSYYLGRKTAGWLHPETVLSYFANTQQLEDVSDSIVRTRYNDFVLETADDPRDRVGLLAIE
jgi:putative transposase